MEEVSENKLKYKAVLVIVVAAIFVGVIASYLAFVGRLGDTFRYFMTDNWSWVLYLLPAIGLTLITLLRVKYFNGTEGTGIPQTIAVLNEDSEKERERFLSLRILVGKLLLTTFGLFSGASMGREGPTVHAGACLMYLCRKIAIFPQHLVQRGLILAGGAAGIAAAFNAPIAGVVFSIEEIGRSFSKKNLAVVITVVLIACFVCIEVSGNYWFYGKVQSQSATTSVWICTPLIAICMGIIGGLFSQIVVCLYPKVAKVMTKHPVTVPCSIGIGIGLIGWLSSGETLGTGYVEAENMLMHGAEMEWYYAPLRLIATGLTLLSGIPGGLFDPSLSAGAGFGQWFANVMHNFEWSADIDPTVVMMIAMASFFAAVVQSPVTAVVIMVEMTGFVHGTMPMLFGSLIAYGISKRFCSCSIYVALAGYYFDENRCNEPRRAACID